MLLSDYVADVQEILHDTSSSSWPLSRVVSRINDARLDVARDMHCIRFNVTGLQLVPGQEIYNLAGAVGGAVVLTGGSNFGGGSTVPVTFSAPPAGGIQALGVGQLSGGILTAINMTQWGLGYAAVPTITIGGVGSGASAVAVPLFQSNPLSTSIGRVLQITKLTIIWNNMRYQPRYMSFTLFDAYTRGINFQEGPPAVWSHHQQAQQIYIQPPPDIGYQVEWDCVFMPSPLVALTDSDGQLIEPWNKAVQFKASEYLLYKHQNQAAVRGMEEKYDRMVPRIITTSGGIRIPNIYNRNFQRRAMR